MVITHIFIMCLKLDCFIEGETDLNLVDLDSVGFLAGGDTVLHL